MSSNSVFALLGVLVFLTFALERVLREARRQREAREVDAYVSSFVRLVAALLPAVLERALVADATPSCGRRCTQPVPSYFDAFLAAKPADSSGGLP